MPILHMDTESVRGLGNLFGQVSTSLEQQVQQLNNRNQSLANNWDSTSADLFDSQLQAVLLRLRGLSTTAATLNKQILQEVIEWEQAGAQLDGASAGSGSVPPKTTPEPKPGPTPVPPKPDPAPKPKPNIPDYDGITPAPGTFGPRPWQPVTPPLTSTEENRDPRLYEEVIDQFAVGNNSRYKQNQQGKNETYCNIFAWDITKAMGAEIPHWVDGNGNAVPVGQGSELSANGAIGWLRNHGSNNGWRAISAEDAQNMANSGKPVVATWHNPNGIGHMGVVRPGEYDPAKGPEMAQAGGRNFNEGHVTDGFGNRPVVYYVHD